MYHLLAESVSFSIITMHPYLAKKQQFCFQRIPQTWNPERWETQKTLKKNLKGLKGA
jgi:hypothetical protein